MAALRAHKERQAAEREAVSAGWQETNAVFPTEFGKLTFHDNLGRALDGVIAWSDPARLETRLKAVRVIAEP